MARGVISLERARRAFRLLGEARELSTGSEAARQHLVTSLARDLGASLGGAVDDRAYSLEGTHGCVRFTLTGFDAQTIGVYAAHHELGSAVNPLHRAIILLRQRGELPAITTVASHELVAPRAWERAPWVAEIVRPARVEHFVTSIGHVGPAAVQGFGFMRAARDRPFSADDLAYLHLVSSECRPLFGQEPPHLAPRARETLEWLLRGASDKEIAAALALSLHTARQYVKTVLRAYRVSSRAQLLARHARGPSLI